MNFARVHKVALATFFFFAANQNKILYSFEKSVMIICIHQINVVFYDATYNTLLEVCRKKVAKKSEMAMSLSKTNTCSSIRCNTLVDNIKNY